MSGPSRGLPGHSHTDNCQPTPGTELGLFLSGEVGSTEVGSTEVEQSSRQGRLSETSVHPGRLHERGHQTGTKGPFPPLTPQA
jgi:hypothetical protein